MSQRFDLNVEGRATGKHISRGLRRDRKVPAVVYGAGAAQNQNIALEEGAITKYNVRAYENALFNLKSTDKKVNDIVVLIKEVIVHPLTRRPQHVDLLAIDLKKAVRVFVEVKLDGKPVGLAEGGLLNIVNRQIEIECLPLEIPANLTADISHLGLGDALHASDITLPKGVKLIASGELTVAVVNLAEEEAATPAAAPAAAAAAAPAAAGKAAAAPAAAKAPAKK
jgi:large subunit ribosomal protein L25